MDAGFALKHQRCCGNGKYCPSHITLASLEELRLQQDIEESHSNKVIYDNQSTWDAKNRNLSSDLIEKHFCQIQSINGAPCAYLLYKNAQVTPSSLHLDGNSEAELFHDQMIKCYPIVKAYQAPGEYHALGFGAPS